MKVLICLAAVLSAVACAGPVVDNQNRSESVAVLEAEPVDTGLTLDEMKVIGSTYAADEIMILRPTQGEHSPWVLIEGIGLGVDRSQGDILTVTESQVLRDGVWWFRTGGFFMHEDGFSVFVPDNTIVIGGLGNIAGAMIDRFSASGGVDCGPGYYACCGTNAYGQWRAVCIANGQEPSGGTRQPTECINGGPGSTGCTSGTAAYVTYQL